MPQRFLLSVLSVLLMSVVLLFFCSSSHADIPRVITYQGKVTDGSGTPVPDGTYSMRFTIFNVESGGTELWYSTPQSIEVTGGIFSVLLGETPDQPEINLPFDADYWLEVWIDGYTQSPRSPLASVGYAYMASGLVSGTGISGSEAFAVLRAYNTNTSQGSGLYGETASTAAGAGVYGKATASEGTAYGIYGETVSTTQCSAIYGYASGFTGHITYGVHGQSVSTSGVGVRGWASCTDGPTSGVRGKATSGEGMGVSGYASATSGENFGVHGLSSSTSGTGVYGIAEATSGTTDGGFFMSESPDGTGVQGEGDYRGGRFRDRDGSNYCYAGYSTYKTYGNGTNAFVQNHPRDSERVIVYAAPEGDEVATYTRGMARLENGEARVSLGETFKWVTNPEIGLTAHLTPRGQWAELYVKSLTTETMVVASRDGMGDVAFDYLVYGLRIGFEEASIVQKKREESYIPSMEDHRATYAKHPNLRRYNALERFRDMHADTYGTDPTGGGAAWSLRHAIEEYDPAVHGPVSEKNPHELRVEKDTTSLTG